MGKASGVEISTNYVVTSNVFVVVHRESITRIRRKRVLEVSVAIKHVNFTECVVSFCEQITFTERL